LNAKNGRKSSQVGSFRSFGIRLTNLKLPAMPFLQMPILEIDGKIIHQSIAICRYLANIVGLVGSNEMEDLEIDGVVDTCNEFRLSMKYKTDRIFV
jgi:hypothetical protein